MRPSSFVAPLFHPGQVAITVAAKLLLERLGVDPRPYINKHLRGDWTTLAEADRMANINAVTDGARVMSRFTLPGGQTLWIITEGEDDNEMRSHTTVMLPSDH